MNSSTKLSLASWPEMHGRRSKPHLVALAELRHVAKVHVRDAAIGQRKDVACGARMDHGPFTDRVTSRPSLTASRTLTNAPPTAAATLPHAAAGSLVAGAQMCVQACALQEAGHTRVRVAMEEAKLQQLPQPRHHSRADEGLRAGGGQAQPASRRTNLRRPYLMLLHSSMPWAHSRLASQDAGAGLPHRTTPTHPPTHPRPLYTLYPQPTHLQVQPRRLDGLHVGAAEAVDPLHHQHLRGRERGGRGEERQAELQTGRVREPCLKDKEPGMKGAAAGGRGDMHCWKGLSVAARCPAPPALSRHPGGIGQAQWAAGGAALGGKGRGLQDRAQQSRVALAQHRTCGPERSRRTHGIFTSGSPSKLAKKSCRHHEARIDTRLRAGKNNMNASTPCEAGCRHSQAVRGGRGSGH